MKFNLATRIKKIFTKIQKRNVRKRTKITHLTQGKKQQPYSKLNNYTNNVFIFIYVYGSKCECNSSTTLQIPIKMKST